MTKQRHLYDESTATIRGRQGDLFDGQPVYVGLACDACGRELVETESGYACCPAGHGKLLTVAGDEPADVLEDLLHWRAKAEGIAQTHATRQAWLDAPPCECGACNQARLDGAA